ncbi:hypothetical protein VNO80_24882 [Phaseolus coccineus]|uniref:EF-hand domain-containing protein n=1 Tax=Phaseolus coccineus TaxID=3886 RepID=A0AAN9LTR5_PHACN
MLRHFIILEKMFFMCFLGISPTLFCCLSGSAEKRETVALHSIAVVDLTGDGVVRDEKALRLLQRDMQLPEQGTPEAPRRQGAGQHPNTLHKRVGQKASSSICPNFKKRYVSAISLFAASSVILVLILQEDEHPMAQQASTALTDPGAMRATPHVSSGCEHPKAFHIIC